MRAKNKKPLARAVGDVVLSASSAVDAAITDAVVRCRLPEARKIERATTSEPFRCKIVPSDSPESERRVASFLEYLLEIARAQKRKEVA